MISQSSLYETVRTATCETFPGYISESKNAAWLIVSHHPLGDHAIQALQASAQTLGINLDDLTYVTLTTPHRDTDEQGNSAHTQLLNLIESLDPLALIITDHASVVCASRAYNMPLALETVEHLLGRPCCCFEDFEKLLKTDAGKRTAWKCLKNLS